MKNNALMIVGHGSRSADAVAEFEQVVACVAAKAVFGKVLGAHMELAKPSIEEVAAELHASGYTKVVVAPYFLFMGNHIKKDIPEILENIAQQYPDMEFNMAKPIGFEPMLADILLKRALESSLNL